MEKGWAFLSISWVTLTLFLETRQHFKLFFFFTGLGKKVFVYTR